ncbi:ATP synthase complex subunit H-domain-containing protein [Sporodiniella umbellata]|nr:ATP synthase complex subunit H-domain-containing protein [Sporodiniella umbellata]
MSIARNAIRSIAVKSARVSIPSMAARSFSVATVMQKDVLQDLFLKELKAYKPQPIAASEESAAKEFKLPAAPVVPEIESDISQQLASYDAEPEEAAH